jgi:hypothetical protein
LFYREESDGDEVQLTSDGNPVSASNVIYTWAGAYDGDPRVAVYAGASITGGTKDTSTNYRYLVTNGAGADTLYNILQFRWTKIAGVATITPHAVIWGSGNFTNSVKVDIGGQNETLTGTSNQQTPEDVSGSGIDVSSLTNGTVYDVTISLGNSINSGTEYAFLGAITLIGSQ